MTENPTKTFLNDHGITDCQAKPMAHRITTIRKALGQPDTLKLINLHKNGNHTTIDTLIDGHTIQLQFLGPSLIGWQAEEIHHRAYGRKATVLADDIATFVIALETL